VPFVLILVHCACHDVHVLGQNAQMRRIDDDLDEMDTALTKANKQVDDLGAGFAKGFAKDVASATRPRMFGGKKKQEEKDAAARAIAEQERREKEARDARYAEERAAKSTGASHMERAAATSKFGSKGVSTQRSCRHLDVNRVGLPITLSARLAAAEEVEPTRL